MKMFLKPFVAKLETCVKPYTDLMLDTDVLEDECYAFIHHKSYKWCFCIDLNENALLISNAEDPETWEQTELENIPFTFQVLNEKLNQYFG